MGSSLTPVITQTLNLSQKSVAYLANDLANVNTPGFKSQQLHFGSALLTALQHQRPLSQVTGHVSTLQGTIQPDGSSVNLTATMSALAQSQLRYQVAAQNLVISQQESQTATQNVP